MIIELPAPGACKVSEIRNEQRGQDVHVIGRREGGAQCLQVDVPHGQVCGHQRDGNAEQHREVCAITAQGELQSAS